MALWETHGPRPGSAPLPKVPIVGCLLSVSRPNGPEMTEWVCLGRPRALEAWPGCPEAADQNTTYTDAVPVKEQLKPRST